MLGGLCVVLGFFLLVTQGQRAHFKKDKEHLRMEFEQYRHQMQAKVNSLASKTGMVYICLYLGMHVIFCMDTIALK